MLRYFGNPHCHEGVLGRVDGVTERLNWPLGSGSSRRSSIANSTSHKTEASRSILEGRRESLILIKSNAKRATVTNAVWTYRNATTALNPFRFCRRLNC